MAADEWLAWLAPRMPRHILLRLYSWWPAAITIGLHQNEQSAVNWLHLNGTPVLRRITGGRAVFHDESELTYALAVDTATSNLATLGTSVTRSSGGIAAALTCFVQRSGIAAQFARRSSPIDRQPRQLHVAPCFSSLARHEITTGSRKVVASAQRRFRTVLLQHGSIKLAGLIDHPALYPAFKRKSCDDHQSPITRTEFDRLTHLFVNTFSGQFGIGINVAAPGADDLKWIHRRAHRLRRIPLEKRDIFFERLNHFTSLSSGCQR